MVMWDPMRLYGGHALQCLGSRYPLPFVAAHCLRVRLAFSSAPLFANHDCDHKPSYFYGVRIGVPLFSKKPSRTYHHFPIACYNQIAKS